jgi:hypothetical protein
VEFIRVLSFFVYLLPERKNKEFELNDEEIEDLNLQ